MTEYPKLPASMSLLYDFFCGCNTRENTYGAILAELERCERGEYQANDGLAAAIVDKLRLSEHGTSIRGSWLTEDGRVALAFLREHGACWDDKEWEHPDGDGSLVGG